MSNSRLEIYNGCCFLLVNGGKNYEVVVVANHSATKGQREFKLVPTHHANSRNK